jgi:hypothetical protein
MRDGQYTPRPISLVAHTRTEKPRNARSPQSKPSLMKASAKTKVSGPSCASPTLAAGQSTPPPRPHESRIAQTKLTLPFRRRLPPCTGISTICTTSGKQSRKSCTTGSSSRSTQTQSEQLFSFSEEPRAEGWMADHERTLPRAV